MIRILLFAAAVLQASGAGMPPASEVPLNDTRKALKLLIAASGAPMVSNESCHPYIRGKSRPTIGDALAERLADFERGSNQIAGGCDGQQCRVVFTHKGGEEDLSQWDYRFRVARGKMVPASLGCFGA